MNIELEYKYLLRELPDFKKFSYIKTNILQNYCILNDSQKKKLYELLDIHSEMHVFRVRKITTLNTNNIKYVLTLKSKGELSREEYECEIDEKMFTELSSNKESTVIKNRYTVNVNNFTFEFDEYLNLSIDLKTVEVELDSKLLSNLEKSDEEINIAKSNIENILENIFLLEIKDVTSDLKYKNSNLYKYFKK